MRFLIKYFEEITGSLLLIAVSLITLFNVLSRYVLSAPLSWAEETATYLFVWMAMIGASLALKTRQHFVIEFVLDRIPGKAGPPARIAVAGLVVLVTGIVMVNGAIYTSWGWNAVTPAMEISRALPYSAVAVGGALMFLRALGLLRQEIVCFKTGTHPTLPELEPTS